VGVDPSAAGENRLRLALSLARDHKAYLAAAYCMADYGAPDSSALAGVQVNFSPGLIVAPQALTAQSGTAFDALPQISREAEYAEQSTIRYAVDRVPFQCTDRRRVSAKVADPWRLSSSLESPPA